MINSNKTKSSNKSLINLLSMIKDHRRKQWQRHSLPIVTLMIIMAMMTWTKSERWISRFIENNKEDIIKNLKINKKKVPSRSVIQWIMQNVDFEELQKIFYNWSLKYITINQWEWISIDGKAVRGTLTDSNDSKQNFLSLITLFASKRKQIISAWKINSKKEGEISKVKELIIQLDLENVVFTIDALHCQKETTKTIIETKNDYVIWCKLNQPKLHKQKKKY